MLGKAGMYIGGLLLFVGLLFFVLLFAGFSSGFFSHSFAQSAVNEIINYTTAQDQLQVNSGLPSVNISGLTSVVAPKLNAQISYVNCGMGCLASSYIKDVTSVNIPMNNIDLSHYELISLIIAIIGIVLLFFSYEKEKKFKAVGRNVISSSIISIVVFYIPMAYIIPVLLAFTVSSYSLKVPTNIFSGFAATILTIDIVIIIVGVVLLAIAAIIPRLRRTPKQNAGTKLIITQK